MAPGAPPGYIHRSMRWQDHQFAPAPGTLLCRVEEVPEGGCKELRFGPDESGLSLLLWRHGGQVRAYVNSCPHFSLPLNARPDEFLLMAGQRLMCAWHCAVFRLEDGHCIQGPAQGMDLQVVAVQVVQGCVRLGSGTEQ